MQSFTMTLHTVQKIDVGEEITIAYTDLLEGHHKRNSRLSASYGFNCSCPRCSFVSSASKNKKVSDDARRDLFKWSESSTHLTFNQWLERTAKGVDNAEKERASGIRDLTAIIRKITSEGLEALRVLHMESVDTLARMYGAAGKSKEFEESTRTAMEVWAIDANWAEPARKRVSIYESWLANPETNFKEWGSRAASRGV
jgi:hypothetical protein